MKLYLILLAILTQSLVFSLSHYPVVEKGSLVVVGIEVVLLLMAERECRRRQTTDTPVLLGVLALVVTLLAGG